MGGVKVSHLCCISFSVTFLIGFLAVRYAPDRRQISSVSLDAPVPVYSATEVLSRGEELNGREIKIDGFFYTDEADNLWITSEITGESNQTNSVRIPARPFLLREGESSTFVIVTGLCQSSGGGTILSPIKLIEIKK